MRSENSSEYHSRKTGTLQSYSLRYKRRMQRTKWSRILHLQQRLYWKPLRRLQTRMRFEL